MLAITDAATHCPVFHEFMIVPAMIYDSLFLGTDRLDTNVTHIGDTAQTARDIGASVLLSSGTGTGQLDFTSGILKVDVNTIKTQTITCAAGVTVLASVGTAATSTAQTGDNYARIGAPVGASISADIASVKSSVGAVTGAVGSVTGNVGGNVTGSVGSVVGAVGSVTGLTASDVGAIKTKTDSLTFTKALELDANIQSVNGVTVNGDGAGTPMGV